MFPPREEVIGIGLSQANLKETYWIEFNPRCLRGWHHPPCLEHKSPLQYTLARMEGVVLLSHCGRSRNLRRNKHLWFTFLTGKWSTNGAMWSVKKTLWYCSILVHKHRKVFPRRQTDRIHYPAKFLGSGLCLILIISSLTTPSLKLK